jgi:hypothetical protein
MAQSLRTGKAVVHKPPPEEDQAEEMVLKPQFRFEIPKIGPLGFLLADRLHQLRSFQMIRMPIVSAVFQQEPSANAPLVAKCGLDAFVGHNAEASLFCSSILKGGTATSTATYTARDTTTVKTTVYTTLYPPSTTARPPTSRVIKALVLRLEFNRALTRHGSHPHRHQGPRHQHRSHRRRFRLLLLHRKPPHH